MTPTREQLAAQLQHMKDMGMDRMLADGASTYSLPVAFVMAIASRETNCRNILGDFQDHVAHGVGILQIDVQWPLAKRMRDDGTWQTDPQPLINMGCEILRNNLHDAQQDFSNQSLMQQLQSAADGYNAGMGREIAHEKSDGGVPDDSITTGHNYGSDVIARMAIFSELINDTPTAA